MVAGEFCPYGCYWDCEHRTTVDPERAKLRAVDDEHGRPLQRCRECGDFFASVVMHSREHVRMRQLGWLPERLPAGWYR